MQTYTVWTKNYTSVDEKCLRNIDGDYIGIQTGTKYSVENHYHSEQLKAQIVAVDSVNQTGMIHLYGESKTDGDENRQFWKSKYIGCYVTVERAHYFGELTVYRCLELGDYWSSNEIKLL